MQEFKDLYLPIFYNTLELAGELNNEEFGLVVRTLLAKLGGRCAPSEDGLPQNLKTTYSFMLDGALRIIGRRKLFVRADSYRKEKPNAEIQNRRYGNFDPQEAFEKALERSYGKKEPEQKACSDM